MTNVILNCIIKKKEGEKLEIINKKSDKELFEAFLNGNNDALNVLMLKYRKNLTNFVMIYVKNLETDEDIVQDSFVYIIINKSEYDFKYSFKTYLYTIAKSRALNYLKREKRKILIESDISNFIESDFTIENNIVTKENTKVLLEAIKKLPQKYQDVISLYYFEEFKYKEISKILNYSISKTKMSIHRAKKTLEKILKEDYKYE